MAAILNLPSWIQTLPSWIQTPCYLLSDSLKNTLTPLWLWLKLIQSDSNSFILTQLDDGSHLEFCHLESDTAILDSAILVFPLKLTHTCQDWFPPFAQKKLHSFILTQLDDGSHLTQILPFGFSHLTHSLKKTSNSFILTQLDDGSHLEFCHLEFGHLGFSHLSIFSQTHSHLPRLVPTICTKKTSLIHSDSTWWWQPSWILPCWIQTLPSWIQTPCYLLSDSLKNTLTPLWLWLKLIQSSNSFILTQLDDGSHLEFCHLEFGHLGFSHFAQNSDSNLTSNSFILTQLDDGSHLEFCHVGFRHCHLGFRHLVIFSQIHSKTLSLHSDSDSN